MKKRETCVDSKTLWKQANDFVRSQPRGWAISGFPKVFLDILDLCPSGIVGNVIQSTPGLASYHFLLSRTHGAPFFPCTFQNFYRFLLFLADKAMSETNDVSAVRPDFQASLTRKSELHTRLQRKISERSEIYTHFNALHDFSNIAQLEDLASTLLYASGANIDSKSEAESARCEYVFQRLVNNIFSPYVYRSLIYSIVLCFFLDSCAPKVQSLCLTYIKTILETINANNFASHFRGIKPSNVCFSSLFIVSALSYIIQNPSEQWKKCFIDVLCQAYQYGATSRVWAIQLLSRILPLLSMNEIENSLEGVKRVFKVGFGLEKTNLEELNVESYCLYDMLRRFETRKRNGDELSKPSTLHRINLFSRKTLATISKTILLQPSIWTTHPSRHPIFSMLLQALSEEAYVPPKTLKYFCKYFLLKLPVATTPQRNVRSWLARNILQISSNTVYGRPGNRLLSKLQVWLTFPRLPTLLARSNTYWKTFQEKSQLKKTLTDFFEQFEDVGNAEHRSSKMFKASGLKKGLVSDNEMTVFSGNRPGPDTSSELNQVMKNSFVLEVRNFLLRQITQIVNISIASHPVDVYAQVLDYIMHFCLVNILFTTEQQGIKVDQTILSPKVDSQHRICLLNQVVRILKHYCSHLVENKKGKRELTSFKEEHVLLNGDFPFLLAHVISLGQEAKIQLLIPDTIALMNPDTTQSICEALRVTEYNSAALLKIEMLNLLLLWIHMHTTEASTSNFTATVITFVHCIQKKESKENESIHDCIAFCELYTALKNTDTNQLKKRLILLLELYFKKLMSPFFLTLNGMKLLTPRGIGTEVSLDRDTAQNDDFSLSSLIPASRFVQAREQRKRKRGKGNKFYLQSGSRPCCHEKRVASVAHFCDFSRSLCVLRLFIELIQHHHVSIFGYHIAQRWLDYGIDLFQNSGRLAEADQICLRNLLLSLRFLKPKALVDASVEFRLVFRIAHKLLSSGARILESHERNLARHAWLKESALSVIETLLKVPLPLKLGTLIGKFFASLILSGRMGAGVRHVILRLKKNLGPTVEYLLNPITFLLRDIMATTSSVKQSNLDGLFFRYGFLSKQKLRRLAPLFDLYDYLYHQKSLTSSPAELDAKTFSFLSCFQLKTNEDKYRKNQQKKLEYFLRLFLPLIQTILHHPTPDCFQLCQKHAYNYILILLREKVPLSRDLLSRLPNIAQKAKLSKKDFNFETIISLKSSKRPKSIDKTKKKEKKNLKKKKREGRRPA